VEERKVKGTMLIDQVRIIRANMDKDWNKYLKSEDWEIIKQTVLPSTWYPLETYRRCGWAVFNIIAGGDPNLARLRGKIRGEELFGDIYKNVVIKDDPMSTLRSFVQIYRTLFNFSTVTFEKAGKKRAMVKHDYDPNDPSNVPYCNMLLGHLEALVEMTGGENVKIEFASKQWEGDPVTNFDIKWE
jgi:hypothetical protein